MDASHADGGRFADGGAGRHDVCDALKAELRIERLDRLALRSEVHDIVELVVRKVCDGIDEDGIGNEVRDRFSIARRFTKRVDLLGWFLRRERFPKPLHLSAAVHDDEGRAAGAHGLPFRVGQRILDAGPGFEESDTRRAAIVVDLNEHALAEVVVKSDALVDDDVLLQGPFEGVPKARVASGCRLEDAIVRLHRVAPADLVVFGLIANRDDANHGLVSGDGGRFVRNVAGNFLELFRLQKRDDVGLARMRGELVKQFHVREAETCGFDSREDLVSFRLDHGLFCVEGELVGPE